MSFETWLLFTAISLAPAISPGPGVFLALSNTIRYGGKATIWSAAGNASGLMVIGFATALGLGALMATSAMAFTALKIIGATYLVWLGIKTWRDKSGMTTGNNDITPP